ncbi:FAD-binding oxidoreductase [Actinomycetospora cinnamomea]|uniref:FAD/FMN-containing dehydrogenase n=1 Tax=Actinomycetospora cinnamomea TaxID=663609 RepID=A0A2U1FFP9_9PSEU|nr:FAD-binding oxidoreductase [Actinomycetospora cinnamomea]PVZ11041.1 FAD/FMN-containing dehydrogenase [Actinomycetospora cinnamomea]
MAQTIETGLEILHPGGEAYDEARTLFNAMIDKRPAAIARCSSAADVAAALRYGRERGLEIAVRSGGHSVGGMSVCDGGLVIDTRPMHAVTVDPEQRLARVGGGCSWGQVDRATQEHGLATTGGRVSTTGVAGLTLGGGSGWLERRHGLACDNLVSVDLVTADGSVVTASADEHPDLFWGLHGAGGNFGVATAFTFRLHPVGPQVLAGLLLFPASRGDDLLRLLREVVPEAPEEFGPAVLYVRVPPEEVLPAELHGRLVAALAVCHVGPVAEGERILAPFRALGPLADLVEPMAYADFQCMLDDPPGMRNWWTAEYLHVVPDEAIDVLHRYSLNAPAASQSAVIPWGGAVARVGEDETPLAQRDATWVVHPFGLWEDPADDDAVMGWARGLRDDVRRFSSGGVYLNFIGDEGQDRVRAAFGERKYRRLVEVKRRYDPENVFRGNQNIPPTADR